MPQEKKQEKKSEEKTESPFSFDLENPLGIVGDFLFGGILDAGKDLIPTEPTEEPISNEADKVEGSDSGNGTKGININIFGNRKVKRGGKPAQLAPAKEEGAPAGVKPENKDGTK